VSGEAQPRVLILSGAYIEQELAAELGVLPPALLPVGTGRLFALQVESLSPLRPQLFLTLPVDFALSAMDAATLAEIGVRILWSPAGLRLGEAVLNALALIGFDEGPIRILHGDTLIRAIDLSTLDAVSVASGGDGYRWAMVSAEQGRVRKIANINPVEDQAQAGESARLSGYFSFSNARGLAQALAQSRGDFIEALNIYNQAHPLSTLADGDWLDFGHVQTYFRSRRIVSTARTFNRLEINDLTVTKRSNRGEKLRAEAYWLGHAPPAIRPYCARLVDEGPDGEGYFYATDYEYLPTLAELYTFGRVNRASWLQILASCGDFMAAAAALGPPESEPDALAALAVEKTAARLEEFAHKTGFDIDATVRLNGRALPSVRACAEAMTDVMAGAPRRPALMHGDFCFSNILYNFRMRRIRLIDPRGCVIEGRPSLYGDSLYDAAKLMHSITGRYDLLIAGRYQGSSALSHDLDLAFEADPEQDGLVQTVREMTLGGVRLGSDEVRALTATLFFSMLPLHADRPARQTAFLANGLRLYLELTEGGGS
jgi:hypothetical protein